LLFFPPPPCPPAETPVKMGWPQEPPPPPRFIEMWGAPRCRGHPRPPLYVLPSLKPLGQSKPRDRSGLKIAAKPLRKPPSEIHIPQEKKTENLASPPERPERNPVLVSPLCVWAMVERNCGQHLWGPLGYFVLLFYPPAFAEAVWGWFGHSPPPPPQHPVQGGGYGPFFAPRPPGW